ncbi:glycosyltransferase family A protein [Chamaesiphon sp. OTE_8_metabat_110]|uniref:glycosyltransferase family 2 protein n=1 Tax=Chamaesiphon sp. OTE_8_metabat_110 TaxID=2964696 RepID=UPI00286B3162|nr:glycosyltransferase family A protein [Chamaesiphon sp. OTE_8_metabat_110]
MTPLVSIVIPCYNSQDFVKQAIESALAQTYSNIEVIVLNDGSTDNSLEAIESFGNRIRSESNTNQGVQLTRNRGIELARGEYIKFLDSDDVLLLDCIETQVAQLSRLPDGTKAIVYGDVLWTDRQLQPISNYPSQPQPPEMDAIAAIISHSPVTSCPIHKREYLLEVGGFDPFLITRHENNLHLRLVLAGVHFVYAPCLVYKYRQYNDHRRLSQSAYTKMGDMYYFEVLEREKALIEEKTAQPLSAEVRSTFARDYWTYGRVVLREGYRDAAQKYFSEARKLDPDRCIVGNYPYPLLVNLLGVSLAEFIIGILSKIKNYLTIK